MAAFHLCTFFSSLLLLFLLCVAQPSYKTSIEATRLVGTVCELTSNYTFCVDALYTDPRTPVVTDRVELADIAFRLAYGSATDTKKYIAEVLKEPPSGDRGEYTNFQICSSDYGKAITEIEVAFNDLNSEDYSKLNDMVGDASRAVDHCQTALEGRAKDQPEKILETRNLDFQGHCEICIAVDKLLNGGFF